MSLLALRPVLYRSTQYKEGDVLPADDPEMVKVWVDAGSAGWADEDEPEAKPAEAEPEAESVPEEKPEKKRAKAPATSRKKSEAK